MGLFRIPQSRLGRFAIVAGAVALCGSLLWALSSFPPPAKDLYYYTTDGGSYSLDVMPDYRSPEWKQYEYRCSMAQLAHRRVRPAGLEYRDRTLCNSAGLEDANFSRAEADFKTHVDNEVWAKRMQVGLHVGLALTWGAVAWAFAVLSTLSAAWIWRGHTQ
jgi:hypothetical protein